MWRGLWFRGCPLILGVAALSRRVRPNRDPHRQENLYRARQMHILRALLAASCSGGPRLRMWNRERLAP